MMMPQMSSNQPPGTWQPWGKRATPDPIVLPLKYPDPANVQEQSGGGGQVEKGNKGKAKGGKGAEKSGDDKWGNDKWGGGGWNNNQKWGKGGGKGSWGNSGYQQ